jgi:hypothetical protein
MTTAAPGSVLVHPQLRRLAARIHDGEAVFFVGAGFSLDSEKLSTDRILRRLIIRLHALEALWSAELGPPDSSRHHAYTRAFWGTFAPCFAWRMPPAPHLGDYTPDHLKRLAERYYEVNEWMCATFAELFHGILHAIAQRRRVRKLRRVDQLSRVLCQLEHDLPLQHVRRELLRRLVARRDGHLHRFDNWAESFRPTPSRWWRIGLKSLASDSHRGSSTAARVWGKMLFLDAVGFCDRAIMAAPPAPTPGAWTDTQAIRRRLRPRHHVLARLAREGFCPTLLTTNFDALLESALHFAGFVPPPDIPPIETSVPHMQVIVSPEAFFSRGNGFRTATLVKLHGCVSEFRRLAEGGGSDDPAALHSLQRYASKIVYTYREIQNWRDDDWAADYLRTLLRTRTFVFSGYSTVDPIIHDTVRSVYEEMARGRNGSGNECILRESAPAYFFAYNSDPTSTEQHEFCGTEVLQAATHAVGARPTRRPADHPNYLRFGCRENSSQRPLPAGSQLDVDEMLTWLHHLVLRREQRRALESHLPLLATRLLGRIPPDEVHRITQKFEDRLAAEYRAVSTPWHSPAERSERRLAFRTATDWTTGFHRALLREWAVGQNLQRTSSPLKALPLLDPLWYFPASESPVWTAWGAVLELALETLARHAIHAWKRTTPNQPPPLPLVTPSQAPRPTVLFRRQPSLAAPLLALTFQVRGFTGPGSRPEIPGHPARRACWNLSCNDIPWPIATTPSLRKPPRSPKRVGAERDHSSAAPDARVIWELALDRLPSAPSTSRLVTLLLGSW